MHARVGSIIRNYYITYRCIFNREKYLATVKLLFSNDCFSCYCNVHKCRSRVRTFAWRLAKIGYFRLTSEKFWLILSVGMLMYITKVVRKKIFCC